ncbi:hypothetical protein Bcav_3875 [Beutenbergia cavernae DSM 12333]|uniref:Htaa domain-containing protein n=1 Tax=Beutenbergia cavernae (strain ATCC BAA-8 / DSM 12333 / CCUG 43141 / JCM 11478 / NBRC 16432 / NCIMB 13614 / HKI 0122) TaxID=471853 RepID=C5C4J3_BEUC1|nr:hypothetical protein [Beutenbergia cavernae]ACQ82117.1 hypothetical protein Bcav_3875 [Beutenbergia cavernae DSM 12333]
MRRRAPVLALALAAGLAAVGAPALATAAGDVDVDVTIPETVTGPFTVSNAELRWGLNEEAGSGSFFGGCNFLSAGEVGDTGGGRVWTAADGFYASRDGNVTIEKPYRTSSGVTRREMPFADRCLDADGTAVSSARHTGTGVQAVIRGGRGEVDPASGDARIEWEGSFTVVFYGGLTYWWVSDPVLEITDGVGTLRGTGGGFGTSMEDMSQWVELDDAEIVLADLSGVNLAGSQGFRGAPAYLGVPVTAPDGAPAQVRQGAAWGSFPPSFVDFQAGTGQAAYWYSSGGIRDAAKPATPVYVSYDADAPVMPDPPPVPTDPGGAGSAPPPTGPGAGTGGGADGSTGAGGAGAPGATGGDGAGLADTAPPGLLDAETYLPASGLIPDVAAAFDDPAERFAWALSGVFSLAGTAVVGFRRGWLALPWSAA